MVMETEQAKCSFCGRPQRLVLYLVKGAGGRNICDLCVLDARSRTEPVDTGPWGSQCSFCGRQSEETEIMLLSEDTGICSDCVENCGKTIDRVLGGESEFLTETPDIDDRKKLAELKSLAISFTEHFNTLRKSFEDGDIDWNVHNLLAQTIYPLKSKAGLMKLGQVTELMWEIESLFQGIRFDDIEKNRPNVEKLSAYVEKLNDLLVSD